MASSHSTPVAALIEGARLAKTLSGDGYLITIIVAIEGAKVCVVNEDTGKKFQTIMAWEQIDALRSPESFLKALITSSLGKLKRDSIAKAVKSD